MSGKLEVEFTSGVWTDISSYVKTDPEIQLDFGVDTWDDDGQAGRIQFTLENTDGRFTPDNPLSPYWQNIVEGVRCRWTITHNAVAYPRGVFYIQSWVLDTADVPHRSTVAVVATDKMASLSRRTMDSDIIERYRYTATTSGATWFDAWPLVTSGHPQRPHNVGFPERPSGQLVDPKNGRGASTYADPTPLVVEGSITTTPNTNLGPVVVYTTQATLAAPTRSITFWLRIPGSEVPLDSFAVLASGWDRFNRCVFRFVVAQVTGTTKQRLELHYDIDPVTDVGTGFTIDGQFNDGVWHSFYLQESTTTTSSDLFYDSINNTGFAATYAFNIKNVVAIVMGGDVRPNAYPAKNRSVTMSHAALMASDQKATGIEKYAIGNATSTGQARFLTDYANWGGFSAAFLGTAASRTVVLTSSSGQTVTDASQQLARTLAGLMWVRYTDDVVEMLDGANMRPRAVTLTLNVGPDDDVRPGQVWRRGALENPTRQEVQSPAGDGTFIDDQAEVRQRRDGSAISTACPSPQASRSLAAWYVRRGKGLRPSQFGIDVNSAVQDLWTFVLTQLKPGVKIRLNQLDTTQYGYSYRDVYVIGWSETWSEIENGEQACRVVFNSVPADTPAESVVEDTVGDYSRFDFDLQQASIGALTASGTSITITSTGPALTTNSADYPLNLNLDGETVTVASAPASSSSPQTVTITRGVLGSVARAHPAGTLVQVFPMSGFGA